MISELASIARDLREIARYGAGVVSDLRVIGLALFESDYDEARRIVSEVEQSKAAGKAAWLAAKAAGKGKKP
jgi:hypothetical protein